MDFSGPSLKPYAYKAGQSTSEYAILLGLVAVVSIGGLLSMNSGVQAGISSIFNNASSSSTPAKLTPVGVSATILPGDAASEGDGSAEKAIQSFANTFSSTDNISQMIETAGSSGSTLALLQNLQAQAEHYLATGQISEQEYTNLKALTDKGYRMAAAEKVAEDALASVNGDTSKFGNKTFQLEGKSYTWNELQGLYDYCTDCGYTSSIFNEFQAERDSVVGNIKDKEARNIVTTLSDQILLLGDTVNLDKTVSVADVANELKKSGVISSANTSIPKPPSEITTDNSTAICAEGKQSNGLVCK